MSNVLENLIKHDSDFSESKFKSKVENEFVKIKLSMVTRKTEAIKHFVNDETYDKIIKKISDDISNKRIQMYDELNVAGVEIVNVQELEDYFQIDVSVSSRSLEYYLDLTTKRYLSGNNSSRTKCVTNMTLKKKKDNKKLGAARTCPSCGANIDINKTGVCKYCGTIFKLENYDWIITYMDI